jgi:hypothetical protein
VSLGWDRGCVGFGWSEPLFVSRMPPSRTLNYLCSAVVVGWEGGGLPG